MRLIRWATCLLAASLAAGAVVAPAAHGDDAPRAPAAPLPVPGEPQPSVDLGPAAEGEVWHVERDGVRLALPVGDLSAPVQEILRERLLGQGWVFVEGPAPGPRPPPAPDAGTRPLPDRVPRRLPEPRLPPLPRPPVPPQPFAGATLLAPEADGAGWRVASVPTTSLAAAIGLRFGDRILGIDGAGSRAALRQAERRLRRGGQLGLLVARRDGRLEEILISPVEVLPEPAPIHPAPSHPGEPEAGANGPRPPSAPPAAGEAPAPAKETPR